MGRRTKTAVAGAAVAAIVAAAAAASVGFRKPTVYRVDPETVCHTTVATIHYAPGQTGPTKKRIASPAAPGLKATALSKTSVRIDWSLKPTPDKCGTDALLLSVGRYPRRSAEEWLPRTTFVETHGATRGSTRISWLGSLPSPDVALASAMMRNGARSRTVAVLIRR